jgi:uncharacterized repeat protein (TIGR02543 family)
MKFILIVFLSTIILAGVISAGSFTPDPVNPGSSLYTLTDIYNKIASSTYSGAELGVHSFDPEVNTDVGNFQTLAQIWNAISWPVPDNSGTLAAGFYATTSLEIVESSFRAKNIVSGVEIFGITGTCEPVISTFTVTYDGNGNDGGDAPSDGNEYENGATVTVLDNTGSLIKDDYVFSGWNTQADGLGTSQATSSTFVMGAENVTLYAEWVLKVLPSITYSSAPLYIHPVDNSAGAEWGCIGQAITTSATNGSANTNTIIGACATPGIAARICADLSFGSYSDWYLPASDQLSTIYSQRNSVNKGDYVDSWVAMPDRYWSSTHTDSNRAKVVFFSYLSTQNYQKDNDVPQVRCVRSN